MAKVTGEQLRLLRRLLWDAKFPPKMCDTRTLSTVTRSGWASTVDGFLRLTDSGHKVASKEE